MKGYEHLTEADARQLGRQSAPKEKRQKFNARRTEIDGISFDSKKEARRYVELKLRAQTRDIRDLMMQQDFPLYVVGGEEKVCIGHYRCDFFYLERLADHDAWDHVVEDVKGVRTALYAWKKKHFEAQYGLTIREI